MNAGGCRAGNNFRLPRKTPSHACGDRMKDALKTIATRYGGGRAPTYGAHVDPVSGAFFVGHAGPHTQYLPPEPPPREGIPRWIPVVVLLVAAAIAVLAVVLIGGSEVDVPK